MPSHFSDQEIFGDSMLFLDTTPPDDRLLLFSGFGDDDELDFLDVVSPYSPTPTIDVYLRRQERIGAVNYGMVELDTDAVMRVEMGLESESQVLPAGTRVIFDTEVTIGALANAEVVTVTSVPLPPGVAGGVIRARSTVASIAMLTRATVASKMVERLVPYARVGHASGYYPIPNRVDVMFYGDGEAVLTGFPQQVTMYAASFNALLGRPVNTGTVQTLVLTNPRILLPAGSRMPRVWWQGLSLPYFSTRSDSTLFPHLVVVSSLGIRTTMASLTSPPVGVATIALSRGYQVGYHEVFSISPGTEIIADTIEAYIPVITIVAGTPNRLRADIPISDSLAGTTLTRIAVPANSGFDLPLETAGVPNLKAVAAEGGVLVQEYDFAGVTHTIALARVLPGQVIRSRSGGPGGLTRIEMDFGSIDGDIEFEEFAAEDLIFSQNNPLFYAIADECRDLHAKHDREIVDRNDCADGDGEGLLVEVLPDEEVILPEETVAPPHLVIASRDAHGQGVDLEVSYGSSTIAVNALQLREDGQLRPLLRFLPTNAPSLPGYDVEVIQGGTTDRLAITPGTEVTIATSSPEGFEFYLAGDSLRMTQMSVTIFHDRRHAALGDPRQQLVMIAGGFTKGYEHLPAYRRLINPGHTLTLGIDSVIANGGLPEPTRAGPGSSHNGDDISGYQSLPGTDLGGAVFTVAADLPLKRRGFDNSYPVVDLIERGTTVTVASPRVQTNTSGRFVDLIGVNSIPLGPPGYAWQGVVSGPGVVLQTAVNTEVALRSYVKRLSIDVSHSMPGHANAVTVLATVGGTVVMVEGFSADAVPHRFMPMGIFARSGSGNFSKSFRYGSETIITNNGITVTGQSSCVLCFGPDTGITATVASTLTRPASPVPFNVINSGAGELITVRVSNTPSTAIFSYTLTLIRNGRLSGEHTGSTIDFDDSFARYQVVVTITDVSPAYLDHTGTVQAGRDIVVFVNSSVDFTVQHDYEPVVFQHQGLHTTNDPVTPSANADGYVYDPDSGSYVTVSIPEPHLLADSHSELSDSSGMRGPAHRIDLFPDSELAARSVFTFGRYGAASDLFPEIEINRYPDASATLRLPLPLNIHTTQGQPVIANYPGVPFDIPRVLAGTISVHPVNEQTANYMQVYLDTPSQLPDDSYVDLSLPAGSNTDIILQVPVPVLTVGGERVYGGSVINLRDGTLLPAQRFNITAPIVITLGSGEAIGNIVGGGGVGRPQIVQRPRIVQGRARLSVDLTVSVLYAPAAFVGNTDLSVVARPGVDYQVVLNMKNDVDPYWAAVDYSFDNYQHDLRTSDAVMLLESGGGMVLAPNSQLDPTTLAGNKNAFLSAGHRIRFPAGRVITILPPQDAPRTPNRNRVDTLDVFSLPGAVPIDTEGIHSTTNRSETGSAAGDAYAIANASQLRLLESTWTPTNYGIPYHLPGLPTVNVGGDLSVVIRDPVIEPGVRLSDSRFVHATVSLAAIGVSTMNKARLIDESSFTDVYQNVWIRIADEIEVIESSTSTLTLEAGTVINPILGTYLPPSGDVAYERSEASRYVLNSPESVQLAKIASFGRPALMIPAGVRVNTGQRRVRFTNVKGLIAHSPYPLESGIECGISDLDLGSNTIVQADEGVRTAVLSTLTVTFAGGANDLPDSRPGTGHPCVLLDLSENSDMDRHFIYSSKSLRSSDRAVQVRVNDVMRLIGGRLEL